MNIHKAKELILITLKKEGVVTTSEIAKLLKISWNTAEKYLLELALDQKLQRVKKAGVNLWVRT
jgi:Mn-dependent DtxR family transcriptional regulator